MIFLRVRKGFITLLNDKTTEKQPPLINIENKVKLTTFERKSSERPVVLFLVILKKLTLHQSIVIVCKVPMASRIL